MKSSSVVFLATVLEIILAKKTTDLVLLFHKKTTKLVFLWPNLGQNKHQSVNETSPPTYNQYKIKYKINIYYTT